MELLAPSGSIECFEAAVVNGADAIYIGAPSLNARSLAKDFSYSEIASMISYAHRNNVKVYVAMNSLIKDEEIPKVVESLSVFSGIGVDALIVQDLGILRIIKRYFPNLRVHASTLMGAHNSFSIKQFTQMGFSRIVLAREMNLNEIHSACQATNIEIEVFIQGAMCFAFSGLCLFSSFQGGKSGLRGKCVQPCRRNYKWKDNSGAKADGYLFSMNDLNGIEHVNKLRSAGVNSLKIEGRMRSRNYIENIVKAYRLIIDNASDNTDITNKAQDFVKKAMGRSTSSGYFVPQADSNLISHQHSGNIGIFVGKIKKTREKTAKIQLKTSVCIGDRFRIHHEKSGERSSYTVKHIIANNKSVQSASQGEYVWLDVTELATVNDSIYKVDIKDSRNKELGTTFNPRKFNKIINAEKQRSRIKKIINQLSPQGKNKPFKPQRNQGVCQNRPTKQRHKSTKFKSSKCHDRNIFNPSLPWFLKIDDLNFLRNITQHSSLPARIVILLTNKTYKQFKNHSFAGELLKKITWSLPPVIFENTLNDTLEKIVWLSSKGFHHWQISHITQIELFETAGLMIKEKQQSCAVRTDKHRKKKRRFIKFTGFKLYGNFTLNIMNSLSLETLADYGVTMNQISIEADNRMVNSLCRTGKSPVGITVWGFPPLFTSRLQPDYFQFNKIFISPKNEQFTLENQNGMTFAIPAQPFSLIHKLKELAEVGIGYVVIDMSFNTMRNKSFNNMMKHINSTMKIGRTRRYSTFNYFGNLL